MSELLGALPRVGVASADETPAKATRAAWYMLWTICAVTFLRWLDQVVLVVGTEPMRKALVLSDVQIGLLQGFGLSLAAGLGAIPLGWLADRYDRRKVLAACVFVWSAATLWRAYVTSFGEVMASAIGMAVADAALVPIAYALLPLFFKGRQLATANLIYYAVTGLGFSISMMFSGALFGALHDYRDALPSILQGMEPWRAASFIVGAVGPIFCLMVLAIQSTGASNSVGARSQAIRSSQGSNEMTLGEYFRNCWRAPAGIYGSSILLGVGLAPLSAWLAPAIARRFHADPAAVGSEVGAIYLASTVTGMATAALFQKLMGKKYGMLVSMQSGPWLTALCAIPVVGLALLNTQTGAYAAAFLSLVLLIAYNAGMPTIYQKIVPSALRARVMAIAMAVVMVTAAIGPVVVGYLSDTLHHDNGIFIAIAILGVPGTLGSAVLLRWSRPHVRAAIEFSESVDAARVA